MNDELTKLVADWWSQQLEKGDIHNPHTTPLVRDALSRLSGYAKEVPPRTVYLRPGDDRFSVERKYADDLVYTNYGDRDPIEEIEQLMKYIRELEYEVTELQAREQEATS